MISFRAIMANPKSRQIAVIAVVAVVGLVSGSFVAIGGARDAKIIASPSPALIQVITTPTVVNQIVASPSPTPLATPTIKPTTTPTKAAVSSKRTDFLWGVTIMPFPFKDQNETFIVEQFRLANELGLKVVRVEYSPNNLPMNDKVIELAKKYNLKLVFIIPFGPNDIFSDPQLSNNTYNYVANIVNRYKGQVAVWQLATEVASVALISSGHHGVDQVDYPEAKYQAVATWLKAAAKAVKDNDPNAKRLINDQWVHVGFFDRFLKEGGDFDILGWNWFSDMGTNMENPLLNSKTGQRYALMNKLKSFKKEIWLTEVNRRQGSNGGKEKEQADYIQHMAESAYKNSTVKSFMIFNLVEDQMAPPQERGYGLVNIEDGKHWVGGLKQAYRRYQDLIKAK